MPAGEKAGPVPREAAVHVQPGRRDPRGRGLRVRPAGRWRCSSWRSSPTSAGARRSPRWRLSRSPDGSVGPALRRGVVQDAVSVVLGEAQRDGRKQLGELLRRAGAGDRRDDGGAREEPGERDGRDGRLPAVPRSRPARRGREGPCRRGTSRPRRRGRSRPSRPGGTCRRGSRWRARSRGSRRGLRGSRAGRGRSRTRPGGRGCSAAGAPRSGRSPRRFETARASESRGSV